MNQDYRDGWTKIFGERDDINNWKSEQDDVHFVEPPVVEASEVEWKNTRALSIRQPWAELIMLGHKDEENRSRATSVRGRIAIYASLGTDDLEEAEEYGLDADRLPRGVIVGTVELYDCEEDAWKLREPKRLAIPLKPTAHPQPVWFYPFGRD
ncbi:MAG: ASCH domain-containing protein [Planctomycetes bacterium]|nr:ASCH domain-containing protein [Planctomycetota bacterium]